MYCSKCGALNDINSNFCQECGGELVRNTSGGVNQSDSISSYNPLSQDRQYDNEIKNGVQSTFNNQQQNATSYNYTLHKNDKKNTVSLVLGIISLITSMCCFISIPTGIIGLIVGIKSKVKNGISKAGIILSIIGIVLSVVFFCCAAWLIYDIIQDVSAIGNSSIVIDNDEAYNNSDKNKIFNLYPNSKNDKADILLKINGGWKSAIDGETYWEFENGKFWWYKSIYDLDDNYWYGKTKIFRGKEGLSVAGIDETKLDEIIVKSFGKVTENDVYTIVCTPTKIISGGVDKSSTNIPEGATWTYIWILLDNGTEGIEAQVLNVETYDISYYEKIDD